MPLLAPIPVDWPKEPYHDLGADYFERRQPEAQVKRLMRQIEKLGYTVTVSSPAPAA